MWEGIWGRDLFVAGGISVDYDEQRTAMSGMGLDFNIKLEMETPFFNIGWTYLPDDLDSRSSSEGFYQRFKYYDKFQAIKMYVGEEMRKTMARPCCSCH